MRPLSSNQQHRIVSINQPTLRHVVFTNFESTVPISFTKMAAKSKKRPIDSESSDGNQEIKSYLKWKSG